MILFAKDRSRRSGDALRQITPHHCDFDFAGVAESGARNFRSTELEDRIARTRRAVFAQGRGVGEVAGWACCWKTGTVVPAD
jgi:hypothetical protein